MGQHYIRYIFGGILTLYLLAYHVWGYAGHFGIDDMYYAQFAHQWSIGNFIFDNDHYAYRWGIIAPTAWCYYLMGVSDTSSAIAPLLITLATAGLLLFGLRRKSSLIACLGLSIFVLNQWTLYYADKIMPDSFVAACVMAAAVLLYHYRYKNTAIDTNEISTNAPHNHQATLIHAFLFSICLFAGFLSKETIWLSVPIWTWIFISDMWQKRFRRFWLYAFLCGGAILTAYFALIAYKTGNPFHRFYAIRLNSYFMPNCSFDRLPWSALVERLSYGFMAMLTRHGMAVSIFCLLPALLTQPFRQLLAISKPQAYINGVGLMALASAWFMTTSFSHYMPMCPDPRHYLFVVPLAAWAAADVLHNFIGYKKHRLYFVIATWLLFGIAWVNKYEITYTLYLPLAIWATVVAFYPSKPTTVTANADSQVAATNTEKISGYGFYLMLVLVAILLIHPTFVQMPMAAQNGYKVQKAFIWNFFKNKEQPITVITNEVEKRFAQYYYGFETGKHRYITYKEAKNGDIDPNTEVYVLTEGLTQWLTGRTWDDYPAYVQKPPASFEKVYDNNKNITVYKVNNIADLQ
jgi:hypothetical protein